MRVEQRLAVGVVEVAVTPVLERRIARDLQRRGRAAAAAEARGGVEVDAARAGGRGEVERLRAPARPRDRDEVRRQRAELAAQADRGAEQAQAARLLVAPAAAA